MLSKFELPVSKSFATGATVFTIGVIVALIQVLIIVNIMTFPGGVTTHETKTTADANVAFQQEQTDNNNTVTIRLLGLDNADTVHAIHGDKKSTRTIDEEGESIKIQNVEEGENIDVIADKEHGPRSIVETYEVQ